MLRICIVASIAAVLAVPSFAQNAPDAKHKTVAEYAMANPANNQELEPAPRLGDSVPDDIDLQQYRGAKDYAYFYNRGHPVIVDLQTRSVVKIVRPEKER